MSNKEENKIPKIVHYVWMGKGEKNNHIKRCMKTWKRHLKGYEIIEWNEDRFDINSHPFVKYAYENKKWAFVSDYVRFYAIYNMGGVYFDTDIVMASDIDDLLKNEAFVGYESDDMPFTAVFGAKPKHEFAKKVLEYYDSIDLEKFEFNWKDNNTISVSNILINNFECKLGNIEQILKNDIKVYKKEILCFPSFKSKTIHAFTSTWTNASYVNNFKHKVRMFMVTRCTNKVNIFIYLLFRRISNFNKVKKNKRDENND